MEIVWADGYGASKYKYVNARKVYDEIISIGDSATPEQIVDRARDENSELHKCFEWNDSIAAEKWRKQEAREIRHFLIIRNEKEPDAPKIHALYFTGNGEGYKAAPAVFRNPDEHAALLQRAYAELRAFSEKYRTLKDEIGEILEMINQLV